MILSFHYGMVNGKFTIGKSMVNDPKAAPCGRPLLHGFYSSDLCSFTIKKFLTPEKDDMNIKVQTHCFLVPCLYIR